MGKKEIRKDADEVEEKEELDKVASRTMKCDQSTCVPILLAVQDPYHDGMEGERYSNRAREGAVPLAWPND